MPIVSGLDVAEARGSFGALDVGSTNERTPIMIGDFRNTLWVSSVTNATPVPIPSVSDLLARVRSSPAWDGASIAPADNQFPLIHVDWHDPHGFVVQSYEDERSWSYFLVTSLDFSPPSIEMELGGQALERWPPELFASVEHATHALNYFLECGKQDPMLAWVRIDSFPRETVWEGREGREAWERDKRPGQTDV